MPVTAVSSALIRIDIDVRVLKRGGIPIAPRETDVVRVAASDGRDVDDTELRREVCLAALEICREVKIQTRAGVHAGVVTVDLDADRGSYTIIGTNRKCRCPLGEAATFASGVLAPAVMVGGLSERATAGAAAVDQSLGVCPVQSKRSRSWASAGTRTCRRWMHVPRKNRGGRMRTGHFRLAVLLFLASLLVPDKVFAQQRCAQPVAIFESVKNSVQLLQAPREPRSRRSDDSPCAQAKRFRSGVTAEP